MIALEQGVAIADHAMQAHGLGHSGYAGFDLLAEEGV